MPMLGSHLLRQPLPEARLEAAQSHLHLVCYHGDHQPASRDDFTCVRISENCPLKASAVGGGRPNRGCCEMAANGSKWQPPPPCRITDRQGMMRNGNGNHQRLQKSKAVTETSATYWVENALYRSLAELIGPIGLAAGKTGNVWEQLLCWHAYEHDKGAFILAVIWNTTTNRRLLQHPATSQGYRNAHTDDPSAHMPPRPLREPPPPPH